MTVSEQARSAGPRSAGPLKNRAYLQADGPRLIRDQTRTPRRLRGERAIVGEIGRGVAEILADECVLDLAVSERDARVEQIVVGPQAGCGVGGCQVIGAEAVADIRVVDLAHQ